MFIIIEFLCCKRSANIMADAVPKKRHHLNQNNTRNILILIDVFPLKN